MLDKKVALITGAGTGIGRATAIKFAGNGARVVVADFNEVEGCKTMQMIVRGGGEAIFIKVDVRMADEVKNMVEKTVEQYGRLDIAFNNAGIWGQGLRLDEVSDEAANAILDTNLRGVWLCMKYEIRAMLRQGGGIIINNASIAGISPSAKEATYSASKHGVVGLTKSVAQEYATDNIRVMAVCPGWIRTPLTGGVIADPEYYASMIEMVPLKRLGEPEDVAELVTWLASDSASYMTGSIVTISGGLCI